MVNRIINQVNDTLRDLRNTVNKKMAPENKIQIK